MNALKRTRVIMLSAAMSLAMAAGAYAAGNTSLDLALDTFPATLDPHEFTTINENVIERNIYEPLINVLDDGTEVPTLAESYSTNEEGTQYTFKIRQGVMFHNGETMTADDVVFSIDRAKNDPYMDTYTGAIDSVEKTDEETVVVTLSGPSPAFMRNLKYITILDDTFCSENESLVTTACGTGPYALENYKTDSEIVLTAFEDYWQGKASIETVTYNYISDPATMVMSFESGDINAIKVPSSEWEKISGNDSYNSGSATQDFVDWLVLNSEVAPLDDVKVRQAVYTAINKEDVIAIAADGIGTIANVLADPAIIDGSTDDFEYLTYDTEKAKSLLEEAGYPDGIDIGEIVYIGGSTYERIASAVQSDLAEAGITVSLRAYDESAIFDAIFKGNFNVAAFASGLGRSYSLYSQLYTTPYYGSLDMCRLQDPEVDEMFNKAEITVDTEERNAIYAELIEKVETGAYYVPLYYEPFIWASDKDLTLVIDDGGFVPYLSAWN